MEVKGRGVQFVFVDGGKTRSVVCGEVVWPQERENFKDDNLGRGADKSNSGKV